MQINEIINQLGLKKADNYYEGVMITGDFKAIGDYGVGLLSMKVQNPSPNGLVVVITTIDDGVWQGYSKKKLILMIYVKNLIKFLE